jgi:hypothetical protein
MEVNFELRNLATRSRCNKMAINTLIHWGGGPIGPPLFKRPVAQKVIKLKKNVDK